MTNFLKKNYFYFFISIFFISGIVLRLNGYLINRPLWHDECSLALSVISTDNFQWAKTLLHNQSAPILFMGLTKFISLIFGTKELVLRFIPLISGIISLYLFYRLTLDLFKKKFSILVTNFLFCFNLQLIYYTQEFKQYSSDVFITVGLLYYTNKYDFSRLDFKQTLIISAIFSILPLMSLPSALIIIAFLISQIIENKGYIIKKVICCAIPILAISTIYFCTLLYKSKANQLSLYESYWDIGFIKLSLTHILNLIKFNNDWFFYPNAHYLLMSIITTFGIAYSCKLKKYFLPLILLLGILVSALNIYPLFQRISLWLIPIIILFIGIFTETFCSNVKKTLLTSVLFILLFYNYNPINFLNKYSEIFVKTYNARNSMEYLSKIYTPENYIIINSASDSEYEYYSDYYQFYTNKTGIINLPEYNKELYFKILNSLPKNKKYIFYYAYDYGHSPVIPFLCEWCNKNKKVLFSKEFYNSVIIKIEN